MEHYKSRNNDFFHFTNPHDDVSELDDEDYDELQYYDVDDDRSCDFSFHTFSPLGITPSPLPNFQTNSLMNQNDTVEELGTFDNGALIFQLDNIMKNLSDKLQHRIEGIDTQISRLGDETCKVDKYVEDVKDSAERHHGTIHGKLRQMQSILQEVPIYTYVIVMVSLFDITAFILFWFSGGIELCYQWKELELSSFHLAISNATNHREQRPHVVTS